MISKKYLPSTSKLFTNHEIKLLDSISEFDKAILDFCGAFGSHPKKNDFIKILSDEQFNDDFEYIYKKLNGSIDIKESNVKKHEFIESLATVIFDEGHDHHGFNHVICGTNSKNGISGLHYYYRLMDLQKRNQISEYNDCRQNHIPETDLIQNRKIGYFDLQSKNWKIKCDDSSIKNFPVRDLIAMMGLLQKVKFNKAQVQRDNVIACTYKTIIQNEEIFFKLVFHQNGMHLITLYPMEKDYCVDREDCYCEFI